jgi:hypothetical protein
MLRMVTMAIACFAVAVVAVVTLDGRVARAGWNEYGGDWDEAAPVGKTLGHEDTSLGDQFFHVEWAATPGPAGEAELTGYVYNDDGEAAVNVELRITELDTAGQPVESSMREVRGTVPGLGRTYFDVRVPASQAYQVHVASFEFVETSGGG